MTINKFYSPQATMSGGGEQIPETLEEWVSKWLFKHVESAPIDLDEHVRVTTFCRKIVYDAYRHLFPSKPKTGLRWIKASERKPEKGKLVIIRPIPRRDIAIVGADSGDASEWATDSSETWWFDDTKWLDESIPSSEPSKKEDNGFKQGYACALACIIQSHGCDTPVEEAYKAGLPPLKKLKGVIDDHDYQILSKYFK